jgi:predicted RNase H-like HicB family nuclease
VRLTVELEREDDGRWIAEIVELPGVMGYGGTREEAIGKVERLAIDVISDRVAHGELASSALGISFSIANEQLARN